ncbi:hypothetical protein BKA70DRAFT_562296 [Coprinopsis sp. MPI-PUGE-AT-0042]|nr:hypothetical protein BKA70DRAFT_562296 [Coprinopsis sp. MPI-PUGE-AT-0042]
MSLHSSRKRTEMACSHCRQRKIKCESNKPHPCRTCQEKGKTCEYMSVAEDPKAATQSRSSPPAQSFATGSSPSYSPASSPPATSAHHGRSYSNASNSQRVPQTSSNRAYAQSGWPSSTQYPSYDQSHIQSPPLNEAPYVRQPSYPYLDATQSAAYQTGSGYPARSQGMLANGVAIPVSDYPGVSATSANWPSQHPNVPFTAGAMTSAPFGFPPHQQQQQYSSSSQSPALPGTIHYQGGYPQEQAYHSSVQENYTQYSSHSAPYQQR